MNYHELLQFYMRDESCPPKSNPKSTVDESFFENKEDDKNEEHECRQNDHAVQPVCLFESSNKLLGSEHERVQGVVCLRCGSQCGSRFISCNWSAKGTNGKITDT